MSPRSLAPLLGLLAACAAPEAARRGAPTPRTQLTSAEQRELAGRLAHAPRRGPDEPIDVAVLPAHVDAALAGRVDGRELTAALVRELRREPRLKVSVIEGEPRGNLEDGARDAMARGVTAPDVWLWIGAVPAPGDGALALEVETWARDGTGRKGAYRAVGTVPGRAALVADTGDELRLALSKIVGPALPTRGAEEALRAELLVRAVTPAPAAGGAARPVDGPGFSKKLPERAAKPDEWKRDSTTQQ